KDERHIDRYDRVFGRCFHGIEGAQKPIELPEEWLRRLAELYMTPEEMARIQALGGLDRLLEELAARLREQKERHQGGNRWSGTTRSRCCSFWTWAGRWTITCASARSCSPRRGRSSSIFSTSTSTTACMRRCGRTTADATSRASACRRGRCCTRIRRTTR